MRKNTPIRDLAIVLALIVSLAGLLMVGSDSSWADDRDLLRQSAAKPYLMIVFDTSSSMSLSATNQWRPGNADDPQSRLFEAKQVLYDVFKDVNDIHLGFASTNQTVTGVRSKHWQYELKKPATPLGFPIGFPATGDIWVFGKHVNATGEGASCAAPFDLTVPEDQLRAQRFSRLDDTGLATTVVWVRQGGLTYKATTSPSGVVNELGSNVLKADLLLEEYDATCTTVNNTFSKNNVQFIRPPNSDPASLPYDTAFEFLMEEVDGGFVGSGGGGGGAAIESRAGFADWTDVQNTFACPAKAGNVQRGFGLEDNYDGTFSGAPTFIPDPLEDPYSTCLDRNNPATCLNLKYPTAESAFGRPMDEGDLMPLHWLVDNKDKFLTRLAPNHPDAAPPNVGVATYFEDFDTNGDGFLDLKNPARRPLMASGETPLGRSVGEFRCWYLGTSVNKCNQALYDPGWEAIASTQDSEWGCRAPYLIVISDGEDSCQGPNPCSDTANLNAKASIRTWVVAYGDYGVNCSAAGNPLKCMAQNGKGELVCPTDPTNLRDELNAILGQIREDIRAFASAAVPTVQANVEDKILLSNFTPLQGESFWDGHFLGFLKPLPLVNGVPDTASPRFLWDAGDVIKTQAPTQVQADAGTLKLGSQPTERRIYYPREVVGGSTVDVGTWPTARRMFEPTVDATPAEIRYDLWEAFGIGFALDDPLIIPIVDQTAQNAANKVIGDTVAIKAATVNTVDPITGAPVIRNITYVMGDIFHSNPAVVGSPLNTRYFAQDAETDNNPATDCTNGDPGYRCFFLKHQFRRKMAFFGTNEGQFHAVEAGLPSNLGLDPLTGDVEVEFDDGSGHELFAYVPRPLMEGVKDRTLPGATHQFGVDGPINAADVFIDPLFSGSPTSSEREWRTVVIGGFREGGAAYYALDVTQPDTLDSDNVPQIVGSYVPNCLGANVDPTAPASCGTLPFPSPLWTFTDSVLDTTTTPATRVLLNEDASLGNGAPDLGDAWSIPNIGRMQLCEGAQCDPTVSPNDIVDKYVAIFSGGMDRTNKYYLPTGVYPGSGNYIYIVDIETGRAIYKRRLDGSAPSEPAAVDTDQNGLLDRIYVPTASGLVYRIDLVADTSSPQPVIPSLSATTVTDINGVSHTVQRVTVDGAGNPLWEPKVIFNANFNGVTPTALPRSIYHRPSVFFVAKLGRYGLSFGTGDREDLWANTQEGRFYVFVDDSDLVAAASLPFTETDLRQVLVSDSPNAGDFLLDRATGQRGWFLQLAAKERVITDPFALSGVTFFSTYIPDITVTPAGGNANPLCAKTGESRLFVVNTTNANAFLKDSFGADTRAQVINNFVTNPYVEQGQSRNVSADPNNPEHADILTPDLAAVMEALKALFPRSCKFASYRQDIKTVSGDTGIVFIAPVPVCIIEKNWKEF